MLPHYFALRKVSVQPYSFTAQLIWFKVTQRHLIYGLRSRRTLFLCLSMQINLPRV